MAMTTHLSLLKEFETKKMIYLDDYGWVETVLYQEILVNQTISYLCIEDLPEEIYEDGFELQTLYMNEFTTGEASIQVDDMIKLLKRCQELKNESNQQSDWLRRDHSNLISKLEALVKCKIIDETDTIEIFYW